MGNPEVVVYTSRNCHYCEKVLGTLEDWNVDFDERNVSENREYFKELQRKNIYGTPAVFIDGEKILGYQERKMKQKLGIKENPQYAMTDSMRFS